MKKIGLDARLIKQTGVGTYLHNLLYYLDQFLPEDIILNVYLKSADIAEIKLSHKNIHLKIANYHWHSLEEQVGFLFFLERENLDLMHFTYFSLPIFYSRKFITTIHDLTPLFYKTGLASTHHPLIYEIKYFFYKLVIKRQIKNALKIITPTAAVKQELMSLFDQVLNKKIVVTHEGVDYRLKQTVSNQSLRLRIGEHKYFLYVGNFYPHKNVAMLIRSFSDLPGQKLVLAGPTNYFSQKIEQLIQTLNLQKKIFFIKNPSLADLKYLYQNCYALIHPSLAEGFGLPIIEAMYFNKPIIASKIKSFIELTEGKYLAFAANSEQDLKAKIRYFLAKKNYEVDYGDFAAKFSFETMTRQTLKVYEECLHEK